MEKKDKRKTVRREDKTNEKGTWEGKGNTEDEKKQRKTEAKTKEKKNRQKYHYNLCGRMGVMLVVRSGGRAVWTFPAISMHILRSTAVQDTH